MPKGDDSIAIFLQRVKKEVEPLSQRGIALIGSFPEGGYLLDPQFTALNGAAIGSLGVELIDRAMTMDVFKNIPAPAVIDLARAAVAYEALGKRPDSGSVRTALLRGRLRLQGTDGIRGPVAAACEGNPVLHYGRTTELTPELVRTMCYAFGRLARRAGVAKKGARVAVCEDGRDLATGWILSRAMKEGLAAAGLTVVDLGVAPTAAVPFAQARGAVPLGVVLTASHNPSSQNGVKFFVDGYKMLPEGPVGDFALSALSYTTAYDGHMAVEEGAIEDGRALIDAFVDYTVSSLPAGTREALSGLDMVFDPANGSFTEIGRSAFAKLGLDVHFVNDAPRGANINQGGGVAELEGRRWIDIEEARGNPAFGSVAVMLERAAARNDGKPVYGLVMDGDGDRGYLVAAQGGRAYVASGDSEGYILARWMRESGAVAASAAAESDFIGTVESDLMVIREAREKLGLATDIGCVGDKWLVRGFRAGRRLVVAAEVSGHVLWPTYTAGPDGAPAPVLSGNGLLTTLAALGAAARLNLSPAEIGQPFPEGTFVTRYTYNVNKALLFKGSLAWDADLQAIRQVLDAAKGTEFAAWRIIDMNDDPDMLYVGIEDAAGGLAATVFVRNSGTENKTCVYARGQKALEPLLSQLCLSLWKMHRQTMKDKELESYSVERAVMDALCAGPLAADHLLSKVAGALGREGDRESFNAVLYGMRKEGLIDFQAGKVARLE